MTDNKKPDGFEKALNKLEDVGVRNAAIVLIIIGELALGLGFWKSLGVLLAVVLLYAAVRALLKRNKSHDDM